MISVIIPVLNEEVALPATLRSILMQAVEKEIIVVDGNSTDSTCDIVRNNNDAKLIISAKGRSRQMNVGAASARGTWLLFLHADTILPADGLGRINELDNTVEAGCFMHQFSGGHWFLKIISRLHNWRFTRTGVVYGDQAMFVRRELFQKIGGFPDKEILEDVCFSEELIKQTQPVQLKSSVITDSRKFLRRGVWKSFFEVVLIQLHCHFKIPLFSKSFFSPVR
jgi:rSAM/selenodomain-associated transferase 2